MAPKVAAHPAVVCKGKDEATCKTEATACNWIVPTKAAAGAKVATPYCRNISGVAKKAADAKKAATGALAKAGAAAKATVSPTASKTAPAAGVTPVAPNVKKN